MCKIGHVVKFCEKLSAYDYPLRISLLSTFNLTLHLLLYPFWKVALKVGFFQRSQQLAMQNFIYIYSCLPVIWVRHRTARRTTSWKQANAKSVSKSWHRFRFPCPLPSFKRTRRASRREEVSGCGWAWVKRVQRSWRNFRRVGDRWDCTTQ